jgi:hypothetical protein
MNKGIKYRNASRIIVSKMLGISGCPPRWGLLATKTIAKKAITSTIDRDVEKVINWSGFPMWVCV